MPFGHKIHDRVSKKVYIDWFLLCMVAGHVNAGGFLSCERFVSHVTGFATLAGIDVVQGHWLHALGVLSIPLYFLIGVMLSAYLTEKHYVSRLHGNRFAPVFWLVGLLLLLAGVLGQSGQFGEFGKVATLQQDYILLALLCGASGLQNAAISSASGYTVRTTHLTGITTDLGLGLVRYFFHPASEADKIKEKLATKIRAVTIISFIFGSAIGAYSYLTMKYLGFLVPAAIAFYIAIMASLGNRLKHK